MRRECLPGFDLVPVVEAVDVAIAFVEPAEQEAAKVDVPDAVVDLLEPDVLFDQDVREVQPAEAARDGTIRADQWWHR